MGVRVEFDREKVTTAIATATTQEKIDDPFQTILNLKYLNQYVKKTHLKMKSLSGILHKLKKDHGDGKC